MTDAGGPIGVFDSGIGGLTVVGALLRRRPDARVLYVADQAHVPYGGRPLEEIRGFATEISRSLAGAGCSAIVMACNISSATALESVRAELSPLPVWGMIAAAARKVAGSGAGRVGVLATQGTVTSGAYTAAIHALSPDTQVVEVACPCFVPLVESGRMDTSEAIEAAREYLRPILDSGCRTVILGCTHYPFLLPALRRAAGFRSGPSFIDPAEALLDEISESLPVSSADSEVPSLLLTTGDLSGFQTQIPRFLPGVQYETGRAQWNAESRLNLVRPNRRYETLRQEGAGPDM